MEMKRFKPTPFQLVKKIKKCKKSSFRIQDSVCVLDFQYSTYTYYKTFHCFKMKLCNTSINNKLKDIFKIIINFYNKFKLCVKTFTDSLSQNYCEIKHIVQQLICSEDNNQRSQSTDQLGFLG